MIYNTINKCNDSYIVYIYSQNHDIFEQGFVRSGLFSAGAERERFSASFYSCLCQIAKKTKFQCSSFTFVPFNRTV